MSTVITEIVAQADSYLSSTSPTTNFGTLTFGLLGTSAGPPPVILRPILAFDTSTAAKDLAGHTIVSVTLSLQAFIPATTPAPYWWEQMLRTDWSETQATWQMRNALMPWAEAGCSGLGLDYTEEGRSEGQLPIDDSKPHLHTTDEMKALFLKTLPAGRLLLRGRLQDESGGTFFASFHSREAEDPKNHPRLIIVSEPPPPPPPPSLTVAEKILILK